MKKTIQKLTSLCCLIDGYQQLAQKNFEAAQVSNYEAQKNFEAGKISMAKEIQGHLKEIIKNFPAVPVGIVEGCNCETHAEMLSCSKECSRGGVL